MSAGKKEPLVPGTEGEARLPGAADALDDYEQTHPDSLRRRPGDVKPAGTAVPRRGMLGPVRVPLPVTTAVAGAVGGLTAVTARRPDRHARVVEALGVSWPDLARLRLHRLGTNLVVPPPGLLSTTPLHLLALGAAERRMGSRRVLAVAVGGDLLATLPLTVAGRLGAAGERGRWLVQQRDHGTSTVGCAAVLGAAWELGPRSRAVAVPVALLSLALPAVRRRRPADVQHLCAGLAGLALARATRRLSR